jgi:hypothetical protein
MQSQQSYEMGGDEWDWEIRRTNPRIDMPPLTNAAAQAYNKRRATRMARAM